MRVSALVLVRKKATKMFLVLFEVEPRDGRWGDYLATAKLLRLELESVDGFIDNTRFGSCRKEGRILSLSTWRDEKSLIRWRTHATHHEIGQQRGRFEIFANYRLRVAEVVDDTHHRAGIRQQQNRYDETEVSSTKAVSVIEPVDPEDNAALPGLSPGGALVDIERFAGVLAPHVPLLLGSWTALTEGRAGTPDHPGVRIRHARVIRDYGMHARQEAPQYFPKVQR